MSEHAFASGPRWDTPDPAVAEAASNLMRAAAAADKAMMLAPSGSGANLVIVVHGQFISTAVRELVEAFMESMQREGICTRHGPGCKGHDAGRN